MSPHTLEADGPLVVDMGAERNGAVHAEKNRQINGTIAERNGHTASQLYMALTAEQVRRKYEQAGYSIKGDVADDGENLRFIQPRYDRRRET